MRENDAFWRRHGGGGRARIRSRTAMTGVVRFGFGFEGARVFRRGAKFSLKFPARVPFRKVGGASGSANFDEQYEQRGLIMATNRLPDGLAGLLVLAESALAGAQSIGAELPLLINTAPLISAELNAAQSAQLAFLTARGGLAPLSEAMRMEREAAYAFCFTARDVLRIFCGRAWNEGWLAVGFANGLEVPRSYAGLRELLEALAHYLTLNPAHEVPGVGLTAMIASARLAAFRAAHEAVVSHKALVETRVQARDAAVGVLRKRLSDLNKELSMRLGPLDPRWLLFGFNQPGTAEAPPVPEEVVVTPQAGARFQVRCAPAPRAKRYRYYVQRPVLDPVPVPVGGSAEPLFVTPALEPGTEYLVYVSAVNEGAESELSAPVAARTDGVLAA